MLDFLILLNEFQNPFIFCSIIRLQSCEFVNEKLKKRQAVFEDLLGVEHLMGFIVGLNGLRLRHFPALQLFRVMQNGEVALPRFLMQGLQLMQEFVVLGPIEEVVGLEFLVIVIYKLVEFFLDGEIFFKVYPILHLENYIKMYTLSTQQPKVTIITPNSQQPTMTITANSRHRQCVTRSQSSTLTRDNRVFNENCHSSQFVADMPYLQLLLGASFHLQMSKIVGYDYEYHLCLITVFISVIFRMYRNKENNQSRMSRTSKASLPDFEGENLEEYMEILYTHQKQWEKEGRYMEADMAKKKLTQMRQQLDKHKKSDLLSKHEDERNEVEVAHVEEMAEFNKYWDEKMVEYQSEAEKLEDQTLERHQTEMEEFEKEIEESIGYKQKESSEVINLKRIEENLARVENYVEAHRVQRQIQELERQEYEKWVHIRSNKIKNLLGQLKNKQENEVSALRQRIEQGFEEQKKARNSEYDKLVQKYMNFIKELETHQHQEIIRFDKAAKMQIASNFSKAASMSRALQSIQSRN